MVSRALFFLIAAAVCFMSRASFAAPAPLPHVLALAFLVGGVVLV